MEKVIRGVNVLIKKLFYVLSFFILGVSSVWSFNSEDTLDPIIGVWTNYTIVDFPDENDEEKIVTKFTVDTTLTVMEDGTFILMNELEGYDPDGPFTATEEYTGNWEEVDSNHYDMEAHNIDIWGSGTGTYYPEKDEFTTIWIEPRGEFISEFTRSE